MLRLDPALLARLPVSPVDLTEMPDEVSRQLFGALRLEMTYDHEHHHVAARITLTRYARPARVCMVPPTGFEPVPPP